MSKLGFVAIVAVLILSVQCQKSDCFSKTKISSHYTSNGDILRIPVEDYLVGNNLDISVDKGLLDIKSAYIVKSPEEGETATSSEDLIGCTKTARGVTENDFVALCQNTKLIFFSLKPGSRAFYRPQTLDLSAEVTSCSGLQISQQTDKLYVI